MQVLTPDLASVLLAILVLGALKGIHITSNTSIRLLVSQIA